MSTLNEIERAAPASMEMFSEVIFTLIPMDGDDESCSCVMLPARANPYTVGEVLLCGDLSPELFEAIGKSAVKLMLSRDLRTLYASDVVESGDGICIERRPIAPDLSDIRGCNTTHSGIAIREPAHGTIAGANTIRASVPVNRKKKRRFF